MTRPGSPIMLLLLAKVPLLAFAIPVAIVAFVAVILVIAFRAEKARRAALFTLLAERRFTVVEKPTKEQKQEFFQPFSTFTHLRHGATSLRWFAARPRTRGETRIIEHVYVVSTGKSSHAVTHTCVAALGQADPAVPASWPLLTLEGESFLHRIGEKLGAKPDIALDDEAFNRRWRVKCPDEGFAIAVLSPEVQKLLTGEQAAGEAWSFGGPSSMVSVTIQSQAKPERLAFLIDHLEAVIKAMPSEASQGLGL